MMYYHERNGMDDTALAGWVASSLAYLTGTCTDLPWRDATADSERTEPMSEATEVTGYAVTIRISPEDFERLCENSGDLRNAMPWLFERLREGGQSASMRRQWLQIYWTGQEYVNLLLARSFLEAIGEPFQVAVDEGADETGRANGWVILTDYLSPAWQKLEQETAR